MTQLLEALTLPFRRLPAAAPRVLQPKRQEIVFRYSVVLGDATALVATFLLSYAMRNRFTGYGTLLPLESYGWVLTAVLGVWLSLTRVYGLDSSRSYTSLRDVIATTVKVHGIGSLVVLSALYMMKAYDVSRLFMQTFLAVSVLVMVGERVLIWSVLANMARRPSRYVRKLLVIGATHSARRLHQLFKTHPHWGGEVVGLVSTCADDDVWAEVGQPGVVGTIHDVPNLLDTMVLDEVVVTDGVTDPAHIHQLAQVCLERGVTFHSLVPMPATRNGRYHAEALDDGLYLMSLEATEGSIVPMLIKRAIDITGALVGLFAFSLVYLIFAPIILWESKGSVLFTQTRVGRNGRLFTLYKLRTMYCDAEARKASLAADNELSGHVFKMRDDPRVTRIGRVLRRTYLDEFPQFWNVLRGEMSLVGTRPPTVEEAALYAPRHRRRLSIRPGLTGLWQVQGNGRVNDFEKVVKLDCEYIERWSIWLDLRLLLQTCVTIARLSGH